MPKRNAARSQHVSLSEAARLLGRHQGTIRNWLSKGAPAVVEANRALGRDWRIDLGQVLEWRLEQERERLTAAHESELAAMRGAAAAGGDTPPLATSIAKKRAAEASLAALRLGEERRRLIDRNLIARAWDAVLGMIRQRWLGFPDRVAGPVLDALGLGPEHRVQLVAVLAHHAHEVLEELAGTEVRYDDVPAPVLEDPAAGAERRAPSRPRRARSGAARSASA